MRTAADRNGTRPYGCFWPNPDLPLRGFNVRLQATADLDQADRADRLRRVTEAAYALCPLVRVCASSPISLFVAQTASTERHAAKIEALQGFNIRRWSERGLNY